jgi:hypothetical protein
VTETQVAHLISHGTVGDVTHGPRDRRLIGSTTSTGPAAPARVADTTTEAIDA